MKVSRGQGQAALRRHAAGVINPSSGNFRPAFASETCKFAVVRIVVCCFRRQQHDELATARFNDRGQIIAFVRRHVTRTAVRAIVLARA